MPCPLKLTVHSCCIFHLYSDHLKLLSVSNKMMFLLLKNNSFLHLFSFIIIIEITVKLMTWITFWPNMQCHIINEFDTYANSPEMR